MRSLRSVAVVALSALGATLLGVLRKTGPTSFDRRTSRRLRNLGPLGARKEVSTLEQPWVVMVKAANTAALVARRSGRAALCTIVAPALALGVTSIVKHRVNRPRPWSHVFRRHGLESFPSSHTAGGAALAWALATTFPARRSTRAAAAGVAALDIAVIALARTAACAHWPTDTLAGAAIGVGAAELVAALVGRRETSP